MNFDASWERVKRLTGWSKYGELADFIGTTSQSVSGVKGRGSFPLEWAFKIAQAYDSTTDWTMTGEGPMKRGEHVLESVERYEHGDQVAMKVFSLAGAGNPNELTNTEPVARIVIPKDFYRPSIVPVLIRGRSMEDTILNGAIVGVDRADKWVISGEIYAVWLPYEGAVVKRLYLDTEKITCKSDNPKFTDFIVPLDRVDEHSIQGRVRWVIQKY